MRYAKIDLSVTRQVSAESITMEWIKTQLGVLVAIAAMAAGGLCAFATLQADVRGMQTAVMGKADKDTVIRELDAVRAQLDRIEQKIDTHMAKK